MRTVLLYTTVKQTEYMMYAIHSMASATSHSVLLPIMLTKQPNFLSEHVSTYTALNTSQVISGTICTGNDLNSSIKALKEASWPLR